MTSRERVRAALSHQVPDRIPTDLGTTNCTSIVRHTHTALREELGLAPAPDHFLFTPFQIMRCGEDVLEALEVDTRAVCGNYDAYPVRWHAADLYEDAFGVQFKMPENGLYFDFWKYPLAGFETLAEIEAHYTWPDPLVPEAVDGLRERAQGLDRENRYALVGDVVNSGIWERSWNLRGMEQFLVDLLEEPDIAHYILRHTVEYQKARMDQYLGAVGEFLDVVFVGDDLATAASTLLSPATFREMVKPYMREYFAFIKARTPAKLLYHSCGAIAPFVDDLIEIGVDILNPVQCNAAGMEPARLKERFGGRIAFWGAVDAFQVMPHGDAAGVRAEVEHKIRTLGPAGYVLCENHNIQADVPARNVVEMYRHAKTVAL